MQPFFHFDVIIVYDVMVRLLLTFMLSTLLLFSCKADEQGGVLEPVTVLRITGVRINGRDWSSSTILKNVDVKRNTVVEVMFSDTIETKAFNYSKIRFSKELSANFVASAGEDGKTLILTSTVLPKGLTDYTMTLDTGKYLGGLVYTPFNSGFITGIDSTSKFPLMGVESLLTLIQEKTSDYFWSYAHPQSGMARERTGSGDIVTTGGSGFGIMAILVAVERGFVTRAQALERLTTIVDFLKNRSDRFHGAYPHWLNGSTGKVVPFSTKDDGADLVETAFLIQGLLTVQSYFNGQEPLEHSLRDDIQQIWEGVEWDWFRQNGQQKLYWHWSPNWGWDMNMAVTGWNEALIVYILAASSPTHSIPASVYHDGWARGGAIMNNNSYYGIILPLGEEKGGPLFFSQYSFLGLDPRYLSDSYAASYMVQNVAHSRINYLYCKANPVGYPGYSQDCWGLTASDIPDGYTASSPLNDRGTIAPTAALSSFPYTPQESLRALSFFYYVLGDKLWGEYGFKDAFNLDVPWFADSYLAIDQGPIVIMIENYRTGLLWRLFMQNQNIRAGLTKLGFTY